MKNLENQLKSSRSQLDSIELKASEIEKRGVHDMDRYTQHSNVKLAQLYDQLEKINMRMQHNLTQQIQAMNDNGVSEDTIREVRIMFDYLDKDKTGFLAHDELKSCLRALGKFN